jgi:hypothetical protein
MLFQNCILLKESWISPFICSKKDFVSKTIGTGVFLWGATSKRDSMWHSPVFTCISPNRIPVKRIKRTVVGNFEMLVGLSCHWAHRPLHLIKLIMGIITDIIISAHAGDKLVWRQEFHHKKENKSVLQSSGIFKNLFPKVVEFQKLPLIFLDKGNAWMLQITIFGSLKIRIS